MCGIAGVVSKFPIEEYKINNCIKKLNRRGPDSSGHITRKIGNGFYLYLIHTRLAIIDLDDRSDQPFETAKSDLIFNGEIYNYLELKESLSKDYYFKTKGDCEVLSNLLDAKGIEGLNKCEGMWSFARFDKSTNKLTICRDRFGEKPLFLTQDNYGSIYFGSEPKAIFALIGTDLPINTNHLTRFLVNGYKSLYKTKDTFFTNLKELSPGSVGEWNPHSGYREWSWWKPPLFTESNDLSFEEAVSITRDKLIRAVDLRMRADVPIAFCLSGGVDSNALVSIAKRQLGKDVHGFTIINEDERYEEKDMIDLAVKELDIKHTSIAIDSKNFISNLKEQILLHDSPICTINYYAHWRLMNSIADKGYKVSVSGTGADEIFSGYYDHHLAYLAFLNKQHHYLYQESLSNWKEKVSPIVRNPFLKNKDYFIERPYGRDHIYLDSLKYSSFLKEPFHEPFFELNYTDNILRNRMLNELFSEIVPPILHEDDLNSMSFSIENRSPYLDSSLMEWSYSIPTSFLIKDGLAKAVLRQSVKGIAPNKVINNPRKVGFNIPIDQYLDLNSESTFSWFKKENPADIIIDKKKLIPLLTKKNITNSESKFIFNYINVRLFMENYI